MKLTQEYTIIVIIFIISFVILLEGTTFLFILFSSKKILEKTIIDSLEVSKQKTTELGEYMTTYLSNLIMNYITKLKLIRKHIYIFNGKDNLNGKTIFNKNSNIFLNNKDLKNQILLADTKEIYKQEHFKKIFNNTTQKFDYIEFYKEEFSNESDNNKILNKFKNEYKELNYVSYYNVKEGAANLNNLDEETVKKIYYLIPVLKSIFLQRFIARKSLMDIFRIIILNEENLIIYPPEDKNKINFFYFFDPTPDSLCNPAESDYYLCFYNLMYNGFGDFEEFYSKIDFNIFLTDICVKFTFYKGKPLGSLLCIDIDVLKLLDSFNLKNTKNFNFGIFSPVDFEDILPNGITLKLKDVFIMANSNKDSYNELKEVFNSTKATPYNYVFDENDPMKQLFQYYSLYHFMYLDTTKVIKAHPELEVNISKLEEEYGVLIDKIFDAKNNTENQVSTFLFNKTTCRKKLIKNDYECFTDEAQMSIIHLLMRMNKLDDDLVETKDVVDVDHFLYIYSIIYSNPKTNKKDIGVILYIKLLRFILFNLFLTSIIFTIFFVIINYCSDCSFDNINNINKLMNQITINENLGKINILTENKGLKANKEMMNISQMYDLLRNSLIIKEVFDNELFLKKYQIFFYYLVKEIKDKNIKEICNSFLAIYHFKNKAYKLAEMELDSIVKYLKEAEIKLKIGEEYNKIKDAIKRSSTVTYINEYTNFDNIDENMLEMIYLNIYKQKFIYLYAMTKFKIGSEINNKSKKDKEKKEKYFKEAIKYFEECKYINNLLGINQIKIIYSLIMISKSYLNLNDYKNSVSSIIEALSLYFNFSKTFNDYHAKFYNPKIMLFVETNIFNQIIFTLCRIFIAFNKPCASNYIILKIFETSPFILNSIHYNASLHLSYFFEKNKNKMNRFYKNFNKKANLVKSFEKTKKLFAKFVSRLNYKELISYNITKTTGSKFSSINIKQSLIESNLVSSKNKKSDYVNSKMSSAYNNRNKTMNKNITICISEKMLEKINIQKFNDILINYLLKYFTPVENDKFSFIQFARNGKKTLIFQPRPLNDFISILYKTKYKVEINNEISNQKKSNVFIGLHELLYSIIKNYQPNELDDNIIMLFIESEDIRFSSIQECLNIVEELNKNISSVYFFCFDEVIEREKINNIQSFLNGLIEGYFFQVKNIEQIKEVFVYLSNNKYQSNLLKFNYECFDHCL